MKRLPAIAETIHNASLGVWLGALAMTGAVAAVVFPTMKSLDPSLPAYGAYDGPHWSLAAGAVMARVFTIADIVALVAASLALLSFALRAAGGFSSGRLVLALRTVSLLTAIGLLSWWLFMLAPEMDGHLKQHWIAAEAGRNEVAEAHRAAFAEAHPVASSIFKVESVAVAIALLSGLWAGMRQSSATGIRELRPTREFAARLNKS